MTSLPLTILHEQPDDAPAIDRLQDRAFGPGRYARSAYRLREGIAPAAGLCFVARVGTFLVGSNRMTRILVGRAEALLLGPLVVDPAFRSRGVGEALIDASLRAASEAGHSLVLLVGDEAYYRRFGFVRTPHGLITLPGPVDPDRLLWRPIADGAGFGEGGRVRRAFG